MSGTIWKAQLANVAVQEIEVPEGSELLCARGKHGVICVWYRCDPAAPKTRRKIAIVGTGQGAPGAEGRYLGTAFLLGGDLVFHVFEEDGSPVLTGGRLGVVACSAEPSLASPSAADVVATDGEVAP